MDLSVRSSTSINSATNGSLNVGIHDQYNFDPQYSNTCNTGINGDPMQSLSSTMWIGDRKGSVLTEDPLSEKPDSLVGNGCLDLDYSSKYESNYQYLQSSSQAPYMERQIAGPIKTFENISDELTLSQNVIENSQQHLENNQNFDYSHQIHNYKQENYTEHYQGANEASLLETNNDKRIIEEGEDLENNIFVLSGKKNKTTSLETNSGKRIIEEGEDFENNIFVLSGKQISYNTSHGKNDKYKTYDNSLSLNDSKLCSSKANLDNSSITPSVKEIPNVIERDASIHDTNYDAEFSKNDNNSSNTFPRISVVSPTKLFSPDDAISDDTKNKYERKESLLDSNDLIQSSSRLSDRDSEIDPQQQSLTDLDNTGSDTQHENYGKNLENDANNITSKDHISSERVSEKDSNVNNVNKNSPLRETTFLQDDIPVKECISDPINTEGPEHEILSNASKTLFTKQQEHEVNNSKTSDSESIESEKGIKVNGKITNNTLSNNTTVGSNKPNDVSESINDTNKQRTYKCSCCDSAFKTSYELERHSRIHSGERPFKCNYCSLSFKLKHHVEVHMRRHEEDRRHSCNICGMLFMTSSCLLRHKRRTHSLQENGSSIKDGKYKGLCKSKPSRLSKSGKSNRKITHDEFDFTDGTKDTIDDNKEYFDNETTSLETNNDERIIEEGEDLENNIFVLSGIKQETKKSRSGGNSHSRVKILNSHRKRAAPPPRESNNRTSRQRVSYAELDDGIENFVESDEELIPYKRINLKHKREEEAYNAQIEELGEVGKIISSRLGNHLRGGALTVTRKRAFTVPENKEEEKDNMKEEDKVEDNIKEESKEEDNMKNESTEKDHKKIESNESKEEEMKEENKEKDNRKIESNELKEEEKIKTEVPSESDKASELEQTKPGDSVIKPNEKLQDTYKNSVKSSDNQYPSLSTRLRNKARKNISYVCDTKDEDKRNDDVKEKEGEINKSRFRDRTYRKINYALDLKDEDGEEIKKDRRDENEQNTSRLRIRSTKKINYSLDIKDDDEDGREIVKPMKREFNKNHSSNKLDIENDEIYGRENNETVRGICRKNYSMYKKNKEDYNNKEVAKTVRPFRKGCIKKYSLAEREDEDQTGKDEEDKNQRENAIPLAKECNKKDLKKTKNYEHQKEEDGQEKEDVRLLRRGHRKKYSLDENSHDEEEREYVRPSRRGRKKNFSTDIKVDQDEKEKENIRSLRRGYTKNYSMDKNTEDENNEDKEDEIKSVRPLRKRSKKNYSLDKSDDEDDSNEENIKPVQQMQTHKTYGTNRLSSKRTLFPKNSSVFEKDKDERTSTRPTRSCRKRKRNNSREKSPEKERESNKKIKECSINDAKNNNGIIEDINENKKVNQSKNGQQNVKELPEIIKENQGKDCVSTKEDKGIINKKDKSNEDNSEILSRLKDENQVKSIGEKEKESMDTIEHDSTSGNVQKKTFNCKKCNLNFDSTSELESHNCKHSAERPFVCEICGSGFVRKYHLQLHLRRHTGDRRHTCDECGMKFFTKSDLNRHSQVHKSGKAYKCQLCGMSFRKIGQLEQHVHQHLEVSYPNITHNHDVTLNTMSQLSPLGTHTCSACGSTFLTSVLLSQHNLIFGSQCSLLKTLKLQAAQREATNLIQAEDKGPFECVSSQESPLSLVIRKIQSKLDFVGLPPRLPTELLTLQARLTAQLPPPPDASSLIKAGEQLRNLAMRVEESTEEHNQKSTEPVTQDLITKPVVVKNESLSKKLSLEKVVENLKLASSEKVSKRNENNECTGLPFLVKDDINTNKDEQEKKISFIHENISLEASNERAVNVSIQENKNLQTQAVQCAYLKTRYFQELHSHLEFLKYRDLEKAASTNSNEFSKCLDLVNQETNRTINLQYPMEMGIDSIFSNVKNNDEISPFKRVDLTMNSVVSDIMRVVGGKNYGKCVDDNKQEDETERSQSMFNNENIHVNDTKSLSNMSEDLNNLGLKTILDISRKLIDTSTKEA